VAARRGEPPAGYQPERGDFVTLDFTPQAGSEQAGRRPALVLSPRAFNVATGLIFACPVTNQPRGGGFEVAIPAGQAVTGAVLSDHLRSVDWIARVARPVGPAPESVVLEVLARIEAILGLGA
jgi:mRNA interferase MazF